MEVHPVRFFAFHLMWPRRGLRASVLTDDVYDRCFGDKGDVEDITEGSPLFTPHPTRAAPLTTALPSSRHHLYCRV